MHKLERKRIAHDAKLIQDVTLWPCDPLALKTQSWVSQERYGLLHANDRLTVIVRGSGEVEIFNSVAELAEVWTID